MRESQGRTKPVGRNESEKRFGVLGEIPKSVTTTGAPPARFSCYVSGAEQECTRWDPKDGELCLSRRSQRKLWWRPEAVLTCKSIA